MPLRWQEVALPLLLVTVLIVLKYIPATAHLPLARAAGVVAFGYAAVLALRLIQSEESVFIEGWSELRPSMVEYFAAYGSAALAAVLMGAVILTGGRVVDPAQLLAAFIASVGLAGGSLYLVVTSLCVKVRWNAKRLEHRNAFGRTTDIAWSDVVSCRPNWRGVVIRTENERVTYSQFQAGAAELAKLATNRARRNADGTAKAFATL